MNTTLLTNSSTANQTASLSSSFSHSPIHYNVTLFGPSFVYLMRSVSLISLVSPPPIFSVVTRWFLSGTLYSSDQNISFYAPLTPFLIFSCQIFNTTSETVNFLAQAEFVVRIGYIFSLQLVTTVVQNRTNLNFTEISCESNQTINGDVTYTWSYVDLDNNQQVISDTSYLDVVDNTLTIFATNPARSGLYVCSATLDGVDSTKKSQSIAIQIYSPPEVSLEQPEEGDVFYLLENSLFKITCNITGLDVPTVKWLVNGISPNYTGVTLTTNITEPGNFITVPYLLTCSLCKK